MSREIKFRAWDEKNKQFADYEDIEECLSCQNRDGWSSSDGMGCCFGINAVEILADCIIEQYTGLKDKNGKEIYEGDIIHTECQGLNANYEVVYHKVSFGIWRRNNMYESLAFHNICEVIGNIHENSELLGGEE